MPRPRTEAFKEPSATAVAAEAIRTGRVPNLSAPGPVRRHDIASEEEIRVGDPDDSEMYNEYVGEDVPGASAATPDQNSVDDIGRVYGVQEEDSGALRSSSEVLTRRDRHRQELKAPSRQRP